MIHTQARVDEIVQAVIARYNDQKPDYWGYPGECLSYVKRYIDALLNNGLDGTMQAPASMTGLGSGYYTQAPNKIREMFDVQPYDRNASYPQGSLFVNTRSGHIGIMLNNNPGAANATVSHCNADPDGSTVHTGIRTKEKIDGILIIKTLPPAPAAPPAIVHPYTIDNLPNGVESKQIRFNKATHRWGMTYDNFTAMAANPLEAVNAGDLRTVVAICRHNIGYSYYLTDRNEPSGFNVLDCDDYVQPAPAQPNPANTQGATPLPTSDEQYDVVTAIPGYPTANSAVNDTNARGVVASGSYFVFNRQYDMINVTKVKGVPGSWINPKNNVKTYDVVEPVPEEPAAPEESAGIPIIVDVRPVQPKPEPVPTIGDDLDWQKLAPFFTDGRAVPYRATNQNQFEIYDLDDKLPLGQLTPGKKMRLVGTFDFNGRRYGMTKASWEQGYWPNIPMGMVKVDYFQIFLNEVNKLKLVKSIEGIFKKEG
jgi:hypothetical protein